MQYVYHVSEHFVYYVYLTEDAVPYAAYTALSSQWADSGVAILTGQPWILGTAAANSTMQEVKRNGGSESQALTMGVIAGVAETLTEKLAIDSLFRLSDAKTVKDMLWNVVKQAWPEAAEEAVSSVVNLLADSVIMGEKSQYRQLVESGLTPWEAFLELAKEVGLNALGGGLSGFVTGGVKSAVDLTQNKTSPPKIGINDFRDRQNDIFNNLEYDDISSQTEITQRTHQQMVDSGEVVQIPESTQKQTESYYPDLRSMKKQERIPILKQKISELKTELRKYLTSLKGVNYEFEVNGNILEAKLYDTGIREVMEKITQNKASMLMHSDMIFRNARYLYSTPDYDGDPNIYRWNYFYTPVQIGTETVGVRIAVRDMYTPQESQIYNWGIKKDTALDGGGRGRNRIPADISSAVSNDSISNDDGNVKSTLTNAENVELKNEKTTEQTNGNGARQYALGDLLEDRVTGRTWEVTEALPDGRYVVEALGENGQLMQQTLDSNKLQSQFDTIERNDGGGDSVLMHVSIIPKGFLAYSIFPFPSYRKQNPRPRSGVLGELDHTNRSLKLFRIRTRSSMVTSPSRSTSA